jgi:hypothetical protein
MQPSKKPAASAKTSRRPRLPLPAVRQQIFAAAADLIASDDQRELSAVLSKRFGLPERAIDLALVTEGMRHERVAAALRTGILSALESAKDAAASIEDESDAA